MQNWLIIDEKYLDYLRESDSRIPYSDYGENKYKPFFGKLFSKDGLAYVTQISHIQPRHKKMKNGLDFIKIYIPSSSGKDDYLAAVVNLNYMFPIREELLVFLNYADIDKHRTFTSENEKNKYIDLLKKELAAINKIDLEKKAKRLYDLKINSPDTEVAKRCLDFRMLEEYAVQY